MLWPFCTLFLGLMSCDRSLAGDTKPPHHSEQGAEAAAGDSTAVERELLSVSDAEKPTFTMVSAKTRFSRSGQHYVSAALPGEPNVDVAAECSVLGERYGQAIFAPSRRELFIRLVGARVPRHIDVLIATPSADTERRLRVGSIGVSDESPELEARFFEAASARFKHVETPTGLSHFFAGRLKALAGGAYSAATSRLDPTYRGISSAAPFELHAYHPGLADDADVQYARGIGSHALPKTQEPTSWAGVPPFALNQAVYPDTPNNPSSLRIVERLPNYGAHIAGASLVDGLSVVRQISKSHTALAVHAFGGFAVDTFVEQYFDRLMLNVLFSDPSAAAQLSPHISEWAVFFDDPSLITGSAVAIIARAKDVQAVVRWLAGARKYATRMHNTVTVGEWSYLGIPVQHYRSGEVGRDQHLAIDKDVVYIANSRGLLRRILSVKAGQNSLSDSAEYRFMSSQVAAHDGGYPYVEIFAGQRFWSRSFEPRERIAIWRREAARADMQQLSATALLYRWLQGRMPADLGEMTRLGILAEDEAQHSGGLQITYHPDRGVSSSWGTPAFITPVADVDVSAPTMVEANAYEKFRADLRSMKPKPPVFFGRINGGSEPSVRVAYIGREEEPGVQRIVEMCKSTEMEVPDLPDTVQVSLGLAKGTGLYRAIAAMLPEGLEPLEWIGSTVTLGVRLDSTQDQLMSGWDVLLKAPMAWLYSHLAAFMSAPSYVIFDVSDVVALTTMLTDIRRLLQAQAEANIAYAPGPIYEFIPSVHVTGTAPGNGSEWNLYYALAGERLVITPEPEVLEAILQNIQGKKRRMESTGIAGLNLRASWTQHPGDWSLYRTVKESVSNAPKHDYVGLGLIPGDTRDAIHVWTGSPFLTTSASDTSPQADPWSKYVGRFDGIGVSVRVDPADRPTKKPLVVQVNARWSVQ